MLDDTPDSPDWWLLRLGRKLRKRQGQLDDWWRYYRGKPDLPQLPRNAEQAFVDFQRKSRTNFCGMISNASVHRLLALGVTGPDGQPDTAASRWWQANRLDSRQKLVWRVAMTQSVGYMLVGPHPTRVEDNGRPSPLITPEHPRECIVEYDPETGEPYVGLKAWHDDVDGYGHARVFYDDRSFPYRTRERTSGRLPWGPDSWVYAGESDEGEPHDLGRLPLVEFARMPDLGEDPEPEFAGVLDIQDRVNMGILNRMAASRYSGFRQKWVKGHRFAKRTDPATGITVVEQPFTPGPNTVWASEGENAQFGQLDATDLRPFLDEHAADVRDMLIVSQTPAYYYAGDLINISADTVAALDLMHVAKCREHIAAFGEGLEDVMSLAAAQAGMPEDYTEATVRWTDPQYLSPAVKADAATKLSSIGYPLAVIAEDMGETPQRVQRISAAAASERLLAASLLPAPTAPTAGNLPDAGATDE
ncbi:phage portal protein [Streptomyces indicus]|uniref:Phage portal protein, SPP1 Gp6-like n=1 Tax=Streptomyces indicus TaxID=417292 RepID=A0A1G9J7H7_9ACTN|nr:phage portal protein [Streptomyces indicus]SDL33186.1 Phage portal protein, SPP1 Gp6-like [Streptomyces indicus]